MSLCRSCGAEIRWGKTGNDKSMPLDAEPRDDGNILLVDGIIIVCATAEAAVEVAPGEPRYVSHFATCPHAFEHRRVKR